MGRIFDSTIEDNELFTPLMEKALNWGNLGRTRENALNILRVLALNAATARPFGSFSLADQTTGASLAFVRESAKDDKVVQLFGLKWQDESEMIQAAYTTAFITNSLKLALLERVGSTALIPFLESNIKTAGRVMFGDWAIFPELWNFNGVLDIDVLPGGDLDDGINALVRRTGFFGPLLSNNPPVQIPLPEGSTPSLEEAQKAAQDEAEGVPLKRVGALVLGVGAVALAFTFLRCSRRCRQK